MTDNELLNLAARAVGAKTYSEKEWPGLCLSDSFDSTPFLVDSTGEKVRDWTSLDNSADAFDLMVRLSMVVDFEDEPLFAVAAEDGGELAIKQLRIPDSYSAARRVVTRAAAEVGKDMLTHDEFMRLFPE